MMVRWQGKRSRSLAACVLLLAIGLLASACVPEPPPPVTPIQAPPPPPKPAWEFDRGFATNGLLRISSPVDVPPDDAGWANVGDAATLSDGSLVFLAGLEGAAPQLVRVTSTGVIDTAFKANVSPHLSDLAGAPALTVTSDDHIVIAGRLGFCGYVIRRFASNGTLDTSFGAAGSVPLGDPEACHTAALSVDSTNRIVLLYYADIPSSGTDRCRAVRINVNGTIDSTWSNAATNALINIPYAQSVSAFCRQTVPLADGRTLIVAGVTVARLNVNGTLDATYDSGGAVITSESYGDGIKSAALVFNDALVIGTDRYDGDQGWRYSLSRLTKNGSIDQTFGLGGRSRIGFGDLRPDVTMGAPNYDRISRVLPLPAGRLAAIGYSTDGIGIVLLDANGNLNTGLADAGRLVIKGSELAVPGWSISFNTAAVAPSGDIYAVITRNDNFSPITIVHFRLIAS
ncbi:MAG: hypothetical protein WDA60_12330 [Acidimicrobiia bacterium]|jgi:uncharacterized delta-60 repeat protein